MLIARIDIVKSHNNNYQKSSIYSKNTLDK